jgi:aspartokinase-like uncharacterized kinase
VSELGKRYPLLVVPGGGPFADVVRAQDKQFGLSDSVAHWMAILGMEQYGWLLADLIPDGEPVQTLAKAHALSQQGRVPILLPWTLLYLTDPLPHTWDVTSDSVAAWIAATLQTPLLILLKDVDGAFIEYGQKKNHSRLLKRITTGQLECYGVVDRYLPGLVAQYGLELWLINGKRPERLAELLSTGTTVGTRAVEEGSSLQGMKGADSPASASR